MSEFKEKNNVLEKHGGTMDNEFNDGGSRGRKLCEEMIVIIGVRDNEHVVNHRVIVGRVKRESTERY